MKKWIEPLWRNFAADAFKDGGTRNQVQEMRAAFYTGVLALFEVMDTATEADMETLRDDLIEELAEYAAMVDAQMAARESKGNPADGSTKH